MRQFLTIWIFYGILLLTALPAQAEFYCQQVAVNTDFTEGEKTETDLRLYTGWEGRRLQLESANKFCWPENTEDYSQFYLKVGFKDYDQFKGKLDYQWNQRYRIISPQISYYFKPWPELKVSLDYHTETRSAGLAKDRYQLNSEMIGFDYLKDVWNYKLEYGQVQKEYAASSPYTYDKQRLDQELVWRIGPDLKIKCLYHEVAAVYPDNTSLTKDYWKREAVWGGEGWFNEAWRWEGYFSASEKEKGFEPYEEKTNFRTKLRYRTGENRDLFFRFDWTEYIYCSGAPDIDPDFSFDDAEEDPKSRMERKAAMEYHCRFGRLRIETGIFWRSKDYVLSQIMDEEVFGVTGLLHWDLGRVGLELEAAPQGNLWRYSGFYHLKLGYRF